jgi:HSP20 family protein
MIRLPQLLTRAPSRPWFEFDSSLRQLVDEFVEGFETRLPRFVTWTPVAELVETDDELMLTVELPGMSREEIELEIAENLLTIRGEKKQEYEEAKPRYHVWERAYGKFVRSFTLPRPVDAAKVKAEFEKGVLTVHLPKTVEAKALKIEIARA